LAKLTTIEGIGTGLAGKLQKAGVGSIATLLKMGGTKKGRAAIVAASGLDEGRVLKFVNHADLMRIKGVGGEYAELLEAAGVDSVMELKRRKADNLHAAMVETNAKKKLVRQVASAKQVASWVEQAKQLPRAVSH
jgi:predicted flap endonuclease-1-like 5' DNA nuclease